VLVGVNVSVGVGGGLVGVGGTVVFVGGTGVGVRVGGTRVGGTRVLVGAGGVSVGGADVGGVSVGGVSVGTGVGTGVGTTVGGLVGTAVGLFGVRVLVAVGGALVAVSVGGTSVAVLVGVVRPPASDVLVGVVAGKPVSVGVGELATATTSSVGVLSTGVLVGWVTAGRGVTVGTWVMIMLPGVFVGAFCGAAITITSSVGRLARSAGVGLCWLIAVAVARSAACAAAAPGAIGGMTIWIFQGV
jgi:hypothetical protein